MPYLVSYSLVNKGEIWGECFELSTSLGQMTRTYFLRYTKRRRHLISPSHMNFPCKEKCNEKIEGSDDRSCYLSCEGGGRLAVSCRTYVIMQPCYGQVTKITSELRNASMKNWRYAKCLLNVLSSLPTQCCLFSHLIITGKEKWLNLNMRRDCRTAHCHCTDHHKDHRAINTEASSIARWPRD